VESDTGKIRACWKCKSGPVGDEDVPLNPGFVGWKCDYGHMNIEIVETTPITPPYDKTQWPDGPPTEVSPGVYVTELTADQVDAMGNPPPGSTKFIPNNSPADVHTHELLTCLMEEAAEVIQAASKVKRFGPTNIGPDQTQTAAKYLALEMGDMLEVAFRLLEGEHVDANDVLEGRRRKAKRLAQFLQTEITDG